MLTLRPPTERDIAPLYNLADAHATKFLDDYHEISLKYANSLLSDPDSLVIDDSGFPVGLVWFDDKVPGLHSSIHFLLNPEFWRAFLRESTAIKVINHAFESQDIIKLCAYTMDNQKTASKLLKSLGFYQHQVWRSHTHQDGKRRDVTFWELKKSSWNKRNALHDGHKSGEIQSKPELQEV